MLTISCNTAVVTVVMGRDSRSKGTVHVNVRYSIFLADFLIDFNVSLNHFQLAIICACDTLQSKAEISRHIRYYS